MLRYPSKEWVGNEEMNELIQSIEDKRIQKSLLDFWTYTVETDWDTLTLNYVNWFDLSENKTMYLTYGIFGDNRERGPAFVKLKMEFAKAGFYLVNNELPDFLPLILDFASISEPTYSRKVLSIHYPALEKLYENLKEECIPYSHLLDACLMVMEGLLPLKEQKINHNAG